MTIENFATLSVEEQREFAVSLLEKINKEGTFTSETELVLDGVEVSDLTGNLFIDASTKDPIRVSRNATWQLSDDDSSESIPDHDSGIEYYDTADEDAKKAFKTLSAVIDGYKVTLDVADTDDVKITEVEVSEVSHEDSGIGRYEYWGDIGYDSHPYKEIRGDLIESTYCYIYFEVEPADQEPDVTEDI